MRQRISAENAGKGIFFDLVFFVGTADNGAVFPGRKMGIMCIRNRIDFVSTDFLCIARYEIMLSRAEELIAVIVN
jgi:hypothetical protein